MKRTQMKQACASALLALGISLLPALPARADPPTLMAIQPIGKDSSQPIGKDSLKNGVAAHTVLLHCPHPTVQVSGSFFSDAGGTAFASSEGELYDSFMLSTDYSGVLDIQSLSYQAQFQTPWLPDSSKLTSNAPVTFTWQPGGALIGQDDGLDFNGKPEFARAGMFIDPDTIPDLAVFNKSTFTLTFNATPEPGVGGLIVALGVTACALVRLRRRRVLRKLQIGEQK